MLDTLYDINKPFSNQDNSATDVKLRYIMVTLVSDQTIPNIIPFIQKGAPVFDSVYFLHSDRNKKQFEQTVSVIKERFPTLKIIWDSNNLNNASIEDTYTVARALISNLLDEDKAKGEKAIVVCNWTLGTKPMSLGLVEAARDLKCPIIYLDTQNNCLIDPQNIYSDKKIEVEFSIREYLQAYGFTMKKPMVIPNNWLEAAYTIFETLKASFLNKNEVVSIVRKKPLADSNNSLSHYIKWIIDPNITQPALIAKKLENYGICRIINNEESSFSQSFEIETTGDCSKFIEGSWLEYYVYGKLREYFGYTETEWSQLRIASGVSFGRKADGTTLTRNAPEIPNELDVLLMQGVELVLISCKMGGFIRKKSDTATIYELETIARSAGLFRKKILVICQQKKELNLDFLERAKTFGIRILTFEDLIDITKHI